VPSGIGTACRIKPPAARAWSAPAGLSTRPWPRHT